MLQQQGAEALKRQPAPHRAGTAVRNARILLMVALALWMISPMFTSSYVEAYVARLQSMAILNHQGLIGLDDQAYPINSEFLYVTRLGMVWLLQGAMILFHSPELWVLRIITIASFVLLVASSAAFARRWTGAAAWAVVAVAILTPGVLEPSFFFADNLVAAALTSFALALVSKRAGLFRWFAIGAVLACAILIRLDAALAMPAVVAVLWLAIRDYKKIAAAAFAGAFGAVVIFAISYRATGISLVQAFHVGQIFSHLNNNPSIYQTGLLKTRALIFFGFFGLISLPLIVIGAVRNFRTRGKAWSVVMTVFPALFYVAVIPHANEIRDFCIMGAPFVLMHAAIGLQVLLQTLTGAPSRHRSVARALLCGFVLVLVAPPYISMRDGPRTLVGRIYAPPMWRQWQGRTLSMIDRLHVLVDSVQPGHSTLVIASQFEPERYLHLRLLQEGFHLDRVDESRNGCQSIESFHQGTRTMTVIRTENPYGIVPGANASNYLEDLQIVNSLQCLDAQNFSTAYFFSIGKSGEPYWPSLAAPEVEIPARFPLPILHHAQYGFFGSAALQPQDVERLRKAAASSVLAYQASGEPLPVYSDFRTRVGHRLWFPAR